MAYGYNRGNAVVENPEVEAGHNSFFMLLLIVNLIVCINKTKINLSFRHI